MDHRAELKKIRTFAQLVRYLRDEMGWPIDAEDFEELTFDYTPEELGIDAKNAAKIDEIKRLRPLSANQPWGIFFIKFEPKRLPVVALRRILSQVVIKKRATAKAAERAAWAADDLLFVSNYGEGDERRISFAHFSRVDARQDLPTLKVLGWDNLDTPLHLDSVAEKLTKNLAWPTDEKDTDLWRENWRSAFTLRPREVITTARELSISLAKLARAIRDRIKTALAIETDRGPLTKLLKAFREALVHDLDAGGFADMYAQTIAYGLLSARIANPKANTADHLPSQIPVTNPFLKELLETFLKVEGRRGRVGGPGIDFDELGVSEVIELLDDANMDAVIRDFGDLNPQEDPVIHFYEHFLDAYDKKQKVSRGVFYTPRPVVSYIVRSVDELLRAKFGLKEGLADTTTWGEMSKRHKSLTIPDGISPNQAFVEILDPATGTGTFLVEVIDVIHRRMTGNWNALGYDGKKIEALWNEYVPKHLLPRLHGYELLMAPYAIAHLKIGLKLYETGYHFGSDQRARIYLTNALEPATDSSKQMEFKEWIPALAREAESVNEVKRNRRFTVVIGNPPYANVGQLNRIPFILDLLDDYKRGLNERKLNLDDDFIKFIRLSQYLLQTATQGVLGFITNNVYLDGLTHRQMRRSLLEVFPAIRVVNLHGSLRRQELAPDGSRDENVFDIQQGVCIAVMARSCSSEGAAVQYADLWGSRAGKYSTLDKELIRLHDLNVAQLAAKECFFVPQEHQHSDEYAVFPSLTTLFKVSGQGIQTKQDGYALQDTREAIMLVVEDLKRMSVREVASKYSIPEATPSWSISWAKRDVKEHAGSPLRVAVKPFDWRWTYFTGHSNGFLARPRKESTNLMSNANLALVAKRQTKEASFSSVFVVNTPVNEGIFSIDPKGRETLFPLQQRSQQGRDIFGAVQTPSNLNDALLNELLKGRSPEEVFRYVYAVLNSTVYRARYVEYLKIDFPRVPLTGSAELFRSLARLGGELVALHLMESPKLDRTMTTYIGPKKPKVARVDWWQDTVWLDAPAKRKGQATTPGTVGFRGVPEIAWNFRIGGYQVCEKWLKDRKGRTLSKEEITQYQRIIVAIAETIEIMKQIDEVIEEQGGWPGAFQPGEEMPREAPARKVAEKRQHPYKKRN